MLPLLLASIEATHTATEPGLFERFGVEWHYVLIQTVSFLIVLGVLYKLAIKPTIATMEERNLKISEGLKHAEEMQVKLAEAQQESATIIKNSSLEAARLVDEARKTAKEYLDRQTQEASQKANDILIKGQQAIELEHRKMLTEARSEITRLVVVTAERVLAKQLSDSDRAAYNEAATKELTVI